MRGQFVAGIGNAYADEVLWAARLHPFRKRTQLTNDEIDAEMAHSVDLLFDDHQVLIRPDPGPSAGLPFSSGMV